MQADALVPKEHISFRAVPELKEFCQHFLRSTQVDYFYHLKFINSNKLSALTLTPECNKYVIEHNLAASGAELDEGVHYLPMSQASFSRLQVNERFNLHHNLEIVENTNNSIDLFGFAIKYKRPEIVNTYFNKLEYFNRFIGEFKERASALIDKAVQEPISFSLTQNLRDNHTVTLNNNGHLIHLNKRELEALKALYQGYSARETAALLGLSRRTVESYLENIKNKLGVSKKVELMKFIIDQKIF